MGDEYERLKAQYDQIKAEYEDRVTAPFRARIATLESALAQARAEAAGTKDRWAFSRDWLKQHHPQVYYALLLAYDASKAGGT